MVTILLINFLIPYRSSDLNLMSMMNFEIYTHFINSTWRLKQQQICALSFISWYIELRDPMYVYGFIDILHNSLFSKCVFVFLFYSIGLLLLANERMFNKKISFENNYACTTLFNHPINNYDIIHISEIHTHLLKFYETLFITHLKPIVFTWSLFFSS